MDSKPDMPKIKADVNRIEPGEKAKSAGLLSLLFGGAGGGAGGLGGAAGSGGLLATKAGIIALAVMGSAVAGGIGLAGYKVFGPDSSDHMGGSLSLFAPKPKSVATDSNAVAPVNPDGSSQSLNYLAEAAAKDKAADQAAANASAAADGAAAGGAAAGDASAKNDAVAGTVTGNSGAGGAGALGVMKGLTGAKKFGALSGLSAAGNSSASASPAKISEDIGAQKGSIAAFSRGGSAPKTSASSGRAIAGHRSIGTARQQLGSVLRDQRGAITSAAAGRTYDSGSAKAGGAIGPDGGAIGGAGVGGGESAQPKTLPANSIKDTNEQEPPTPKAVHKVTPWENALNIALMMVAAAGALMVGASMILKAAPAGTPMSPTTLLIAKIMLGLAAAVATAAMFFAGMAAFGKDGQVLQGSLIIAAATVTAGLASYMLYSVWDAASAAPSEGKAEVLTKALDPGINSTLLYVIGGVGAAALIAAAFIPKKTISSDKIKGKKPDIGFHQTWSPSRNV